MQKPANVLTLVVALALAPAAYAGPGTAKKAGGIVLISVGSALGGLGLLLGMMVGSGGCDDDHDRDCARNKRAESNLLLGSSVLLAGSIVGGIQLIRAGKEEQRATLGLGAVRPAAVADGSRFPPPLPALKFKLDI